MDQTNNFRAMAELATHFERITTQLRNTDFAQAFIQVKDDIKNALKQIKDNLINAFKDFFNLKGHYQNLRNSISESYSRRRDSFMQRITPPPPPPVSVDSYEDIQRRINRVRNSMNSSRNVSNISGFRSELNDLENQARNHPSQAGSSITAASQASDGGSGGKKGGGFSINGMLGAFGLPGVGAMVGSALKDGAIAAISGSIQKEQDVLGLSNVLGKGKDANAAYKGIRSDAEASSFDTSTLLEANKSLLSVGSGAQQARQDVMNLANAVTATGGGKDQLLKLSEQMKEIKSSGKASGDQLKEFESTGIDVFGMLSASTGKSVAELQKQGVDYAALSQSLGQARGQGGMYEDALGKQNNTVTGKWEMIKEKGSNALTDIGDAFLPIISRVLDIGVQFANSFAPAIQLVQPYIDIIANGLGQAVEFITGLGEGTNTWSGYVDIAQGFISTVWSTLGSVFDAVWSIVSGLITWIANSEMIKDVFAAVYGILGVVLKAVGWVADALKWVWNNVLMPILNGIETAYRWAKELITGKEIKVTKTNEIKASADLANGMKATDAQVKGFMASKGQAKTDLTAAGRPTINKSEDTRRDNAAKSRETGDTVSGGGQKTINITLGKFFDTIQFNTLNSGETSDQLESIVMECLGRVLYNGAKVM